ncbi:MAG: hypothetical protein LKK08_07555 [Bacteroidales bacterium]|jgi:hypothetical protein|nr:hypothetical protein [Bacteroidales bacterium]MCI2146075.1 hypothetical protein [Bacteroidales bacterium]
MRKFNFLSSESSILDSKEALAIVGGSSIADNREANYAGGLHSPQITKDMEIKADLPNGGTDIW